MPNTASGLMAIGILLYSAVALAADPAPTCEASKLGA
jgi:hypothetical protein